MIHIVELCPRTKFVNQGLILLHKADDYAVKWLECVATKALVQLLITLTAIIHIIIAIIINKLILTLSRRIRNKNSSIPMLRDDL